ncbi:MAG: hypothetical protein U0531_08670 [Dehalococcoidia bacterium]
MASAPPPSPTPDARPAVVDLLPGLNQFVYLGAALPVDQALASLPPGSYQAVEWTPPGSQFRMRYVPGESTNRPVILPRSAVSIYMRQQVTVPLGVIWAPNQAR